MIIVISRFWRLLFFSCPTAAFERILINHDTGRPVDVLPDRDSDTFATWLQAHPKVQVITRDRAGAYADGCTRGAPHPTQCTDLWRLWKNLGDAVEKTVIAHREWVRNPADPRDAADSAATAARAGAPPPPSAAHSGCRIPVSDVPNG